MTDTALAIRGLHKSYSDVRAVSDLDLSVPVGECFGLLGKVPHLHGWDVGQRVCADRVCGQPTLPGNQIAQVA